jgi:sensor histidine kinase YesM
MSLGYAFVFTLIFNTLIAVFLTVIGVGDSHLAGNLVWSQCIGLTIGAMTMLAIQANPAGPRRVIAVVGAVTAGTALGVALATMISGESQHHGSVAWQALFIGLFFGAIASAFFWLRERNGVLASELEARELARLEAEKRGIEAQLKMLQAQIEPHFLFNTLANLSCLIEAEPRLATALLDALIRYLRASLTRTRAEGGTLGDEIGLLRAYLEVLQIRMGKRLQFVIDVAPALMSLPLPPMLLQPLVENAIRHGLEPKVEGGTVTISVSRGATSVLMTVQDDGLGFADTEGKAEGLGLANIRARLVALYGSAARLSLSSKVGAGVTAQVEIPA